MLLKINSKSLIYLTKDVFNEKPDFCWEFGYPDNEEKNEEDYKELLKRNYFYNALTFSMYVKSHANC